MPERPTILDLIRNGTMSAEMAATLWASIDERWSYVVVAIPRLAGKTTLGNALLELLPVGVPVHRLSGDEAEMARLENAATGGYLMVGEFSRAPVSTYIWGASVRRVFDILTAGYSLATALHAPGLEETFDVICQGNGVADEQASRIKLMLYLRRFGDEPGKYWRRVAQVYEIDRVEKGCPVGRLLHHWVEEEDRFEAVECSRILREDTKALAARSQLLMAMVESGRTMPSDVAQLVASRHH